MNRILSLTLSLVLITATLGADKNIQKDETAKITVSESEKQNQERVEISVETTKIDRDGLGNFKDAQVLKVKTTKISLSFASLEANILFKNQWRIFL